MITFVKFIFLSLWELFWSTAFDFMVFMLPALWLYAACIKYLKPRKGPDNRNYLFIAAEAVIALWCIVFIMLFCVGIGTTMAKSTSTFVHKGSVSVDLLYWVSAWLMAIAIIPLSVSLQMLVTFSGELTDWAKTKLKVIFFAIPFTLFAFSFPIATSFSFYAEAKKGFQMEAGIDDFNDWLDLELYTYRYSWERPEYLNVNEDALANSFVKTLNDMLQEHVQSAGLHDAVMTLFSIEDHIAEIDEGSIFTGKNLIVEFNTEPTDYMSEDELNAFNQRSIRDQIQALRNCYTSQDPRAMYDVFMRQFFDNIIYKDYNGNLIESFNIRKM